MSGIHRDSGTLDSSSGCLRHLSRLCSSHSWAFWQEGCVCFDLEDGDVEGRGVSPTEAERVCPLTSPPHKRSDPPVAAPLVQSGAHFTRAEMAATTAQAMGSLPSGLEICTTAPDIFYLPELVSVSTSLSFRLCFSLLNYLSQNKGANKKDDTSLIMHIIQEKKPPAFKS